MSEMKFSADMLDFMPRLIRVLADEQGLVLTVADEPHEQWQQLRTLFNTRPPLQASDELLQIQDEFLQAIIRERGIVMLDDAAPTAYKQISLWHGDITSLEIDAIVNAANSQMLGCFVPGHHCIDNAIHTFAGVQLRIDCARLMELQGFEEPTGSAKITPAHNLPCKYIIHTVGPIVRGAPTVSDSELLAKCYLSCLDAALIADIKSIAFPCISTGVFGYLQEEAARVAAAVVLSWLDEHEADIKVVFNTFTERDREIYRNLLIGD